LGGYTSVTFTGASQTAFIDGMASLLKVTPLSAVSITNVADAPGRRRLSAGAIVVEFSVTTTSSSAASGLAASITAVSPESLLSALQKSGLNDCTGVVVSAPVIAAPPKVVVNASAITDIAAATELVTAQFANLTAADAAGVQTDFLNSLSNSTALTLTTAAAENTASLVLAVVSAAPGVVLSLESQSAALSILSSVANAPINVTGGAAQSITAALSAVALSAGESSNPAALAVVQNVLTNLATSQANSLVAALAALPPGAPPPPAATTSSPTIQTLVQIDPPGSSRLSTVPLTAPGSPSAFAPLPADIFKMAQAAAS
jgi:hypothetical protein